MDHYHEMIDCRQIPPWPVSKLILNAPRTPSRRVPNKTSTQQHPGLRAAPAADWPPLPDCGHHFGAAGKSREPSARGDSHPGQWLSQRRGVPAVEDPRIAPFGRGARNGPGPSSLADAARERRRPQGDLPPAGKSAPLSRLFGDGIAPSSKRTPTFLRASRRKTTTGAERGDSSFP